MNRKLSDKNIKEIIRLYKNNNTALSISEKFNVDKSAITYHLKKNNILIRGSKGGLRKYKIKNDNFFNKINTQEKAYWLGFLLADGNIVIIKNKNNKSSKIQLNLCIKDIFHLEKFKKILNTNYPIKKYKCKNGYKKCVIYLNSNKLAKGLMDKGCIPNKTLILKFPTKNKIPKKLIRHLIRGYFDGDGCLSYYINKIYPTYRSYCIDITGAKHIIKSFQRIIKNEIGINLTFKNNNNKKILSIRKSSNPQVIKILKWLYDNSNVCLDRKYKKYVEMIEYYKNVNGGQTKIKS